LPLRLPTADESVVLISKSYGWSLDVRKGWVFAPWVFHVLGVNPRVGRSLCEKPMNFGTWSGTATERFFWSD
jgi:hypothetical protein